MKWQVNLYSDASQEVGQDFQDVMLAYLDLLNRVKVEMREYVVGAIRSDSDEADTQIVIACIIFIVVVILTPTLICMMHNLTTSIQVLTFGGGLTPLFFSCAGFDHLYFFTCAGFYHLYFFTRARFDDLYFSPVQDLTTCTFSLVQDLTTCIFHLCWI